MQRKLEWLLWNSRMIMVIPVITALILAVALFMVTSFQAINLLGTIVSYVFTPSGDRSALYIQIITGIVSVIDGFLISAVLFIFSLGIYELFISRIDAAETSEVGVRLLVIRTLDDLKDRLANVILIILIVKFFQQALSISYRSIEDVFMLAVAIVLIAGTLYLSGRANPMKERTDRPKD